MQKVTLMIHTTSLACFARTLPVPGEMVIQAAIGNSNNPRQCFSHLYLLISITLLPAVSTGVTPSRPEWHRYSLK